MQYIFASIVVAMLAASILIGGCVANPPSAYAPLNQSASPPASLSVSPPVVSPSISSTFVSPPVGSPQVSPTPVSPPVVSPSPFNRSNSTLQSVRCDNRSYAFTVRPGQVVAWVEVPLLGRATIAELNAKGLLVEEAADATKGVAIPAGAMLDLNVSYRDFALGAPSPSGYNNGLFDRSRLYFLIGMKRADARAVQSAIESLEEYGYADVYEDEFGRDTVFEFTCSIGYSQG